MFSTEDVNLTMPFCSLLSVQKKGARVYPTPVPLIVLDFLLILHRFLVSTGYLSVFFFLYLPLCSSANEEGGTAGSSKNASHSCSPLLSILFFLRDSHAFKGLGENYPCSPSSSLPTVPHVVKDDKADYSQETVSLISPHPPISVLSFIVSSPPCWSLFNSVLFRFPVQVHFSPSYGVSLPY